MLALTYGVRQQSVTADTLTYEFGLGVGLRNIPGEALELYAALNGIAEEVPVIVTPPGKKENGD